jgi:hypothetical protein
MGFKTLLLLAAASGALVSAASAAPRQWAKAATGTRVTVGTGNVAVIQPPVAHPDEAPCVVSLYRNAVFGGNNVNFTYTPPASCPGPYATIVLSVDISLNAGIQYDRTGTIWVGGVPFWFGTTAEPSPTQAPSWHFERNVTDYTSTLASAQSGFVLIANYTNPTDTSLITSSATLKFYPATASAPAPRVPDVVIPLNPGGGTVALGNSSSVLNLTTSLPKNIASAAMDVYLQSQSGDEFWYTCVPTALAGELESCGGGTGREGEISIDGTPAGAAPVTPWIYTGGIDPYLWSPIPGAQTLNFNPFRVELSPFAGVLSNGASHTFGLSVFGANNYFSVAGALLLYLDPNTTQVTGSVTKNTLTATPTFTVGNNLVSTASAVKGHVYTTEARNFEIDGSVATSAGTTNYAVKQSINFKNNQYFKVTASSEQQDIEQNTATVVQAIAAGPTKTVTRVTTHTDPLSVMINFAQGPKGNGSQLTKITQNFVDTNVVLDGLTVAAKSYVGNMITTQDRLRFNSSFNITGNSGQVSSASFLRTVPGEPCYGLSLTSSEGILTSATPGCQ